jgi:hypothetical protein
MVVENDVGANSLVEYPRLLRCVSNTRTTKKVVTLVMKAFSASPLEVTRLTPPWCNTLESPRSAMGSDVLPVVDEY